MLKRLTLSWLFVAVYINIPITHGADGDVRLAGSSRPYMGRVEIEFGSEWNTICDDGWGVEEADIVCRQLGFTNGAMLSTTEDNDFGIGSGNILLSDLQCVGNEPDLLTCPGVNLNSNTCFHGQDVSIVCNVNEYLGCYDLNGSFPPGIIRVSTATDSVPECVEACRTLANNALYAAIGLQDSNPKCYCFSGMYTGLIELSNGSCNMECTSDSKQACGGGNAFSIYPVTFGSLGTIYTDVSTGIIYSPAFFNRYAANIDTTWTLTYSEHQTVTISTLMFLLESEDQLTISANGGSNTITHSGFTWSSPPTRTVTLRFTTTSSPVTDYGFLIEYSSVETPIVATTGSVSTTQQIVTTQNTTPQVVTQTDTQTTPEEVTTQQQSASTESVVDSTAPQTASPVPQTTAEVTQATPTEPQTPTSDTSTVALTMESETTVTVRTIEVSTDTGNQQSTDSTTVTPCPTAYGSTVTSPYQLAVDSDDVAVDQENRFECDGFVTGISVYASRSANFTVLIVRQSSGSYIVVGRIDVTSSNTGMTYRDLSSNSARVKVKKYDIVAMAYSSGTLTYKTDGNVRHFLLYRRSDVSNVDSAMIGNILELPHIFEDVRREYPLLMTLQTSAICSIPSDPFGGTFDVSSLSEEESTKLTCKKNYQPVYFDSEIEAEYGITVACQSDGNLSYSGYCTEVEEKKYSTTIIIICTAVVACLGFAMITVTFAILCSRSETSDRGGLGGYDKKSTSMENVLIPLNEDEADFEAYQQSDGGSVHSTEEAQHTEEMTDPQSNDINDVDTANEDVQNGDFEGVDNPVYESSDAVNKEWEPEEAGPDD